MKTVLGLNRPFHFAGKTAQFFQQFCFSIPLWHRHIIFSLPPPPLSFSLSLCLPVSLSLSALILMIILVHVRRDGSFQTQPCIHAHLHMSYIPLIHNNKKEDEEKIHYSELWKLFKHIFMWVKKYWQKALQMFKECLKQAIFQETFIYFLDIRTRYNGIIPDNFIVYRSFFSPSRYLETATY